MISLFNLIGLLAFVILQPVQSEEVLNPGARSGAYFHVKLLELTDKKRVAIAFSRNDEHSLEVNEDKANFEEGMETQKRLANVPDVQCVPNVYREFEFEGERAFVVDELDTESWSTHVKEKREADVVLKGAQQFVLNFKFLHEAGYIRRNLELGDLVFAAPGNKVYLLDYWKVYPTRNLPLAILQMRIINDRTSEEKDSHKKRHDLESFGWVLVNVCRRYGKKRCKFLPELVRYMLKVFAIEGDLDSSSQYQQLEAALFPKNVTFVEEFSDWFFSNYDPNPLGYRRGYRMQLKFKNRIQEMKWMGTISLELDGATVSHGTSGFDQMVDIGASWHATKTYILNQLGNSITPATHDIRYFTDRHGGTSHDGSGNLAYGATIYVSAVQKVVLTLKGWTLDTAAQPSMSPEPTCTVTDWDTRNVDCISLFSTATNPSIITDGTHYLKFYQSGGYTTEITVKPGSNTDVNVQVSSKPEKKKGTTTEITVKPGSNTDVNVQVSSKPEKKKGTTLKVVLVCAALVILIILAAVGLFVKHRRASAALIKREEEEYIELIAWCF